MKGALLLSFDGSVSLAAGGALIAASDGSSGAMASNWDFPATCPCCCGQFAYPFTVTSADRTSDSNTTNDVQSAATVIASVNSRGRAVFELKAGTYGIRYTGGGVEMGCSRTMCGHYDGYFATSFGILEGLVGGAANSCCDSSARTRYDYSSADVYRRLSNLRESGVFQTYTVPTDGFIFKVGYYPWWSTSYVSGSISYELCAPNADSVNRL